MAEPVKTNSQPSNVNSQSSVSSPVSPVTQESVSVELNQKMPVTNLTVSSVPKQKGEGGYYTFKQGVTSINVQAGPKFEANLGDVGTVVFYMESQFGMVYGKPSLVFFCKQAVQFFPNKFAGVVNNLKF